MTLPPSLLALFAAARDTEAPTFNTTLHRLTDALAALKPGATLTPDDMPTLMAHLDGLIAHLTTQKADVVDQLSRLRVGAALNAYKR